MSDDYRGLDRGATVGFFLNGISIAGRIFHQQNVKTFKKTFYRSSAKYLFV